MKRDVGVYLEDILESIRQIETYTMNLAEDNFLKDAQVQDAALRRLEVIGEAVKNMPQEFKDLHAEIPWKKIAGMRDILIHEYFGVDMARVWKLIQDDLPLFKEQISALAKNL
ncbi:MAG: DUF86 domain-containing protein [Candidatus Liptonbacteria bacterium]|nr:DUF86 domain-containing protein [Candidatus Liptonbacteria bacterium]